MVTYPQDLKRIESVLVHETRFRGLRSVTTAYLFPVADDDVVNLVPSRETGEGLVDHVRLVYAEEAALGLPEQAGVVLDRVGFRGGVYDAKHLL